MKFGGALLYTQAELPTRVTGTQLSLLHVCIFHLRVGKTRQMNLVSCIWLGPKLHKVLGFFPLQDDQVILPTGEVSINDF